MVMKGVVDSSIHAVNPQVPKDLSGDFRLMSMDEAFRTFAGFSLENDLVQSGLDHVPRSSPDYARASAEASERLAKRLRERNQPVGNDKEPDDLFHRLFISLVEDRLPMDVPLALTDWPDLVPTLARRRPGTPWAERWELYIRGVEVANCFGEETELDVIKAFWAIEAPKKENAPVPVMMSENWADRISNNLPVCSGAAVGLDRLLALVRGDDSLQGLDLFPIRDIMPR
jgi:lysyl-tRNA synthetase class 2